MERFAKERFIKMRLRGKFVFVFITATAVLSVFIALWYYNSSVKTIKDNYRISVESGLQMVSQNYDTVMKEAYFACVYAVTDDDIQTLMCVEEDSKERLIAALELYKNRNYMIQSVYCYLKESDVLVKVSSDGNQAVAVTDDIRSWMENVLQQAGNNLLSPVYEKDLTVAIQKNLFTFGKTVCDTKGKEIGSIFVNINERDIWFQYLQNVVQEGNDCYIVQGDNYIVSAQYTDLLHTAVEIPDDSICVTVDMPMSDYRIISISEQSTLLSDIQDTRKQIIFITVLINLIFSIVIYRIIERMIWPIQSLGYSMESVAQGNLNVRTEIYYDDEIGALANNFNTMTSKLQQLIEELSTEKILKKEAEIAALQYQITPHFMYNTLSSIRYAAILKQFEKIPDLLQAFIELLRLSASDRGAFITVEYEIRMAENYTKLQNFRYNDSFSVTYEVEPETKDFYVPRLIVQPLVENAILHGLDHKKAGNAICVSVSQKGRMLEIKVQDNGQGMTQNEIRVIMNGEKRSKFSGIGINNIRERLHMYYGNRGQLRYYSMDSQGTIAVITVPVSDSAEEYLI